MGFKVSMGLKLCKLALWQRPLKHRSDLKISTLHFQLLLWRRLMLQRKILSHSENCFSNI